MFSILSSCFQDPIKDSFSAEKKELLLPKVHPGAVSLDWLTTFVLFTLFALSVTGVMPIGSTGSFILLGAAVFEAAIPLFSLVGVCYNLPKGYFKSFFMTTDPLATSK